MTVTGGDRLQASARRLGGGGGDPGRRAPAPLDETLGRQKLVGRQHGVAGHAQLRRQGPRRGQRGTLGQPSLQHGIAQGEVKTPVQRLAVAVMGQA
jgi:hypothetical protein